MICIDCENGFLSLDGRYCIDAVTEPKSDISHQEETWLSGLNVEGCSDYWFIGLGLARRRILGEGGSEVIGGEAPGGEAPGG